MEIHPYIKDLPVINDKASNKNIVSMHFKKCYSGVDTTFAWAQGLPAH